MLGDLFEARLARGGIEMKYGNRADGRTRLAAVEKNRFVWICVDRKKGSGDRKSIRN
jgi:hypothetical protein